MRLWCWYCHNSVTNELPNDTVFRAIAVCPECIQNSDEAKNHPLTVAPQPAERNAAQFRYLVYAIDKHQNAPSLRNDIPEWLKENCDDGADVVVDLLTKKRYWLGEWADVSCYPSSPENAQNSDTAAELAQLRRVAEAAEAWYQWLENAPTVEIGTAAHERFVSELKAWRAGQC